VGAQGSRAEERVAAHGGTAEVVSPHTI